MKKERVVVAMSGGVDSSVAAALLERQGYEVIGITICFNLPDSTTKRPTCCGLQGIEDARRVAYKLGIKHYVLNFSRVLKEKVIKDFCREYLRGRTPNPCVRCNQYIKFGALFKKAVSLGAGFLATGHYARIVKIPNPTSCRTPSTKWHSVRGKSHLVPNTQHKMALGARQIPKYLLKKARDTHKDQSYFLYRLNQKQLRHILFPLGNYTKSQVRRMAKEFALPIADKLASQEICFLPDADYHGFLKTQTKTELKAGPILDKEGNLLGKHKGIAFYTLGQRQGLGIARGYPLYVTKIDAQNNTIRVGKKEEAYAGQFSLKDTHFILKKPQKKEVALEVRIRYNHPEAPARVMFSAARIKVKFKRPQFAITPGQSAVFYAKDTVLGGGIIDRVVQ